MAIRHYHLFTNGMFSSTIFNLVVTFLFQAPFSPCDTQLNIRFHLTMNTVLRGSVVCCSPSNLRVISSSPGWGTPRFTVKWNVCSAVYHKGEKGAWKRKVTTKLKITTMHLSKNHQKYKIGSLFGIHTYYTLLCM